MTAKEDEEKIFEELADFIIQMAIELMSKGNVLAN